VGVPERASSGRAPVDVALPGGCGVAVAVVGGVRGSRVGVDSEEGSAAEKTRCTALRADADD
jgi:hypothetical protein